MRTRKKLIEVALPLDAINAAAKREKSIRHGHPSTLHLWWARRPLAAARAVIFAQMVDDPSADPERFPTEESRSHERERLFRMLEELVTWENTTNEQVLERARARYSGAGGGRVRTTRTTPVRRNCSIRKGFPRSTIRSPGAARCRWKPSDSDWKRTPAISTRWRS